MLDLAGYKDLVLWVLGFLFCVVGVLSSAFNKAAGLAAVDEAVALREEMTRRLSAGEGKMQLVYVQILLTNARADLIKSAGFSFASLIVECLGFLLLVIAIWKTYF